MFEAEHVTSCGPVCSINLDTTADRRVPRLSRLEYDTLDAAGFISRCEIVGRAFGLQAQIPARVWDQWVREGRVPKPIKLSGCSVWRKEDVNTVILRYGAIKAIPQVRREKAGAL